MLTLFSFLIMWLGSFNWFFISAFQYDFVAGFFGTQSSLFSRFIYFIIGIAGFVMLFIAIKNKGKIKLTENVFKKKEQTTKPIVENSENVELKPILEQANNYEPSPMPKKIEQTTKTEVKTGFKDFDSSKYDNN